MIKLISKETYYLLNKFNYKPIASPYVKIIGYFINNELMAFLDYSMIYDKSEINHIYVDLTYRKKGVASLLMNYYFNDIKGKINSITLEVSSLNEAAINLYKKYGFKNVAIREKYYGSSDAYLMYKEGE